MYIFLQMKRCFVQKCRREFNRHYVRNWKYTICERMLTKAGLERIICFPYFRRQDKEKREIVDLTH